MAGIDDDAAVRIEIETAELPPSFIPGATRRVSTGRPSGGGPRTGVLVAAVVIATMSVIAIALLRPDPGETAAGTQRSAPTTSTSTTERPGAAVLADDASEEETVTPRADITVAEGASDFVSIIPWTASYIALGFSTADLLLIYSSVDGQEWSRLPTLVVEVEPLEPQAGEIIDRDFAALGVAADRSLVVSMLESRRDASTGAQRGAKVTRLISEDGLLWSPDPDFEPIVLTDVAQALPLVNTADLTVVGAYRGQTGNPLIEKVLGEFVADAAIVDGCWLDAWSAADLGGDAVAQLQPCSGREPVTLRADQLWDPSLSLDIGPCIIELSGRSGAPMDIYMGRPGDASIRIYTEQGTVAALPVETADGKVAVLEPGRSLAGAPACEGFDVFDAEAPTAPGVSLLEPGEASERISSSDALPDSRLFGLPLSIAVTETDIFVPTGSGVYAFDRELGGWRQRAQPVNRAGTVWIAPDGRQLFTFAGGALFVANADDGDWQLIEVDRRVSPDRLLFADDEVVFFGEGQDIVVIELPSDE